jgi:hypothetical protein
MDVLCSQPNIAKNWAHELIEWKSILDL